MEGDPAYASPPPGTKGTPGYVRTYACVVCVQLVIFRTQPTYPIRGQDHLDYVSPSWHICLG